MAKVMQDRFGIDPSNLKDTTQYEEDKEVIRQKLDYIDLCQNEMKQSGIDMNSHSEIAEQYRTFVKKGLLKHNDYIDIQMRNLKRSKKLEKVLQKDVSDSELSKRKQDLLFASVDKKM